MARRLLIRTAVERATAELAERDVPAIRLALTYARRIDELVDVDDGGVLGDDDERAAGVDPVALSKIGTALLACLNELGLTPKARAAIMKGGAPDDIGPDPLDELTARRAARVDHTPPVDPAAP